ncbi:MAG: CHAT domain-containing protein [Deltaproteobacteria bacterium]
MTALRSTVLVAALAVAPGCRCADNRAPLPTRFAGCSHVLDASQCLVPSEGADLTLWTAAPCGVLFAPDEATKLEVDGGCRVALTAVTEDVVLATTTSVFTLRVSTAPSPTHAGAAQSARARERLGAGDAEDAVALLDAASAAHRAEGVISDAVLDLQAAAYALAVSLHRLADAEARLDAAEPMLADFPEGAAAQPYYRGLVAKLANDPISAQHDFERARTAMHRLGLARFARGVAAQEVIVLRSAGRGEEADALLASLDDGAAEGCDRVRLLQNLSWAALLDADAHGRSLPAEVRARLEEANRLQARHVCDRLADRGSLALATALAALLTDDIVTAREALERALERTPDPELRYWRAELLARVAHERGDTRAALEHLRRAEADAERSLFMAAVWRARSWRARVHLGAGDRVAAMDALLAAERALDDEVLRLPLEAGGAALLANRRSSALALARLHLESGELHEALCVMRAARARRLVDVAQTRRLSNLTRAERLRWYEAIGDLASARAELAASERGAWDLSAAERSLLAADQAALRERMRGALRDAIAVVQSRPTPFVCRPPAPGELVLGVFPRGEGSWWFAADASGVQVVDALTDAPTLTPFDEVLERNASVRVLADGAARAVDVHRLEWRGEPLVANRPVVYGLDLGPLAEADEGRRAVVVGDPRGNLAGARDELVRVAAALEASGWTVEVLRDRDATVERVRDAMQEASLLHFAGHADSRERAPDQLLLADGALTVEDVLTAERVPRRVVLSGCRTSRGSNGIDVAQAFLLAGAEQVVASSEDLPDRSTAAMIAALYTSPSIDLLRGLHDAPGAAQSPLRVWVR